LYAYATTIGDSSVPGSNKDPQLRARAMVACGALRDDKLLPKYEAYLFPKAGPMPKDPIAVAAAFGVARIEDKKALPLSVKLIETVEPIPVEMRIYAAIALGKSHDKAHVATLEAWLKRESWGYGKAAALWALGEIGEASSKPAIEGGAKTSTDPIVRAAAALALARTALPKGKKPTPPSDATIDRFAEGVLDPQDRMRNASILALAALATGEFRAVSEPMPVPEGPITGEGATAALVPKGYGPADLAKALVTFEKPISSAVST